METEDDERTQANCHTGRSAHARSSDISNQNHAEFDESAGTKNNRAEIREAGPRFILSRNISPYQNIHLAPTMVAFSHTEVAQRGSEARRQTNQRENSIGTMQRPESITKPRDDRRTPEGPRPTDNTTQALNNLKK
ncbi:unnamed protein product [Ixodes persulcatus]